MTDPISLPSTNLGTNCTTTDTYFHNNFNNSRWYQLYQSTFQFNDFSLFILRRKKFLQNILTSRDSATWELPQFLDQIYGLMNSPIVGTCSQIRQHSLIG